MKSKAASKKLTNKIISNRRMVFEMIEASMDLAQKKGIHPLTSGCNCIRCVNQRKRILSAPPKPGRFRL